ncbi:hypothetical protein [Sulfitobacter pacificus]|uniref:Uncharacterized protein n=1 Tax=Sulfitobacter pacificus TaxID=1499314 RepID=A0ABQ5VFE3_9RHOB|nr:hypothetical protein [Sulfitobacter pacificus]GLQ25565.1 hypothetical protein GCM10007927_03680 [Sulfitobacter pacificus]
MAAWKEEKKNFILMKLGVSFQKLELKGLRHKNKVLTGKNYDGMVGMSQTPKIKIKRPEGIYEATFVVSWYAKKYDKQSKRNPLPPETPFDYAYEFAPLKMWVKSAKMPKLHVMDIHARLNRIKNDGGKVVMKPVAMLDVDIWTGHSVMGDWTKHTKCCDVLCADNKIRNFK